MENTGKNDGYDEIVLLDGGEIIELKDFMGFAEKVHNRY